jgi:hypothetical protein
VKGQCKVGKSLLGDESPLVKWTRRPCWLARHAAFDWRLRGYQWLLRHFVKLFVRECPQCLLPHEGGPLFALDLYMVANTAVYIWILVLWRHIEVVGSLATLISILAALRLLEVTVVILWDVYPNKTCDATGRPYKEVSGKTRWLLLTFFTVSHVVLCFAILYRYSGRSFEPEIRDSMTAVYQSLLTLTTLGYGDISPKADAVFVKAVVVWELALFLLLLVVRLPMAVSLTEVKDRDDRVGKANGGSTTNEQ